MTPSEDKPNFIKLANESAIRMTFDNIDSESLYVSGYFNACEKIWTDYVEPLRKENAELRLKLKELEEWKRQQIEVTWPLFEWGYKQNDIQLGASIVKHAIGKLENFSKLEQSNRELLRHLKNITEWFDVGCYVDDNAQIMIIDAQRLIDESEGTTKKE